MAENQPTAPDSLPNYLADGLPKQDRETLEDAHDFIDDLIEYQHRPIDPDELPDRGEPVADESDDTTGTIVVENVTCGDENCSCMTENGEKHGPYRYRYYRDGGTLKSEYLGKP
jgi:hypothetical protein